MTGPYEPGGGPKGASDAAGGGHPSLAGGRIARNTVSAVLIVLTCVLVPVALLTVWAAHDIVLDTDRYAAGPTQAARWLR